MCTISYAIVQIRTKVPSPPISPPRNSPEVDTCSHNSTQSLEVRLSTVVPAETPRTPDRLQWRFARCTSMCAREFIPVHLHVEHMDVHQANRLADCRRSRARSNFLRSVCTSSLHLRLLLSMPNSLPPIELSFPLAHVVVTAYEHRRHSPDMQGPFVP